MNDLRKKEGVTYSNYSTTYEYQINSNGMLSVYKTDSIRLELINSSEFVIWPIFYNDEIKIREIEAFSNSGRKISVKNRMCGHYNQSGIFHSDAKICMYALSPKKGENTVLMVNKVEYLDARYFAKIKFTPIYSGQKRVIRVVAPKEMEFTLKEFNFDKEISKSELVLPNGTLQITYALDETIVDSKTENTPAYAYYEPHIVPLVRSYMNPLTQKRERVFQSADDLYLWYKELIREVDNEPDSLEALVNELIEGKENEQDKIREVYMWVQENIKYIAFEEGIMGFKPDNAQNVYYKKYGDCKGMANLLKTMLTMSGISANIAWTGTNVIPYKYEEIPSPATDNHMVCAVDLEGGETLILDATSKHSDYDFIPFHIQGKEVMIDRGETFEIMTLPTYNSQKSYEKYFHSYTLVVDEQKLKGTGSFKLVGDPKNDFLSIQDHIQSDRKKEFQRRFIAGENHKYCSIQVNESAEEGVSGNLETELSDNVSFFSDEVYLDLDFKDPIKDKIIKPSRKVPFDLHRPIFTEIKSVLKIPEGYRVEYIPEDISVSNELLSFSITYSLEKDQLTRQKKINVGQTIIYPESFKTWNESIEYLTDKYNDQIILEKDY